MGCCGGAGLPPPVRNRRREPVDQRDDVVPTSSADDDVGAVGSPWTGSVEGLPGTAGEVVATSRRLLARLATVVTSSVPRMTASESQVGTSGISVTCSPPLMN